MESFNITGLVQGVLIEYENNYQKLIGSSEIDILDIKEKFKSLGMQYIQENKWIFDDYLEVYVYEKEGKFQGIEIKGCISWMKEGVKDSFQIVNKCKEWYGELDIYILGKKIWCDSKDGLDKYVQEAYKNKINLFNRQYGNVKLKVTCSNFYKEINRQNKWYYKLFYRFKRKG